MKNVILDLCRNVCGWDGSNPYEIQSVNLNGDTVTMVIKVLEEPEDEEKQS